MHAERSGPLLGRARLVELFQHRLIFQHQVQQREVKAGHAGLMRAGFVAIVRRVLGEQVAHNADSELAHLVGAFGKSVLQLQQDNADQVVPRAEVRGEEELGANVCKEEARKEGREARLETAKQQQKR